MADISKIEFDNTTYNVKDTTARTAAATAQSTANDKVSKSGDTMTGPIIRKNSNMDSTAASISSSQYTTTIGVQDVNDYYVAFMEGDQINDGETRVQIAARRRDGDTNVNNSLILAVKADGTKRVMFTDAAPWRSALGLGNTSGALPIANGGTGGTDSGWQTLTNSSVFTGTIYYRKIGCFGEIHGYGLKLAEAFTGNSYVTLGQIGSGYYPSKNFMTPFGSTYIIGLISLGSSGQISLYKDRNTASMTTSMSFYFNCMYII